MRTIAVLHNINLFCLRYVLFTGKRKSYRRVLRKTIPNSDEM